MTIEEFDSPLLTDEQRASMKALQARSGISWEDFLEKANIPSGKLFPYVGIVDFNGMFVGIEPDGYTHT